ncbi:MAG: polyprenyl synthetase family protein [Pirellulales bacterium]|jgi:geranylgeranyl diphosphate synthase type II|nr:polyprenyl synthetase family protein [Pirellulales bacterium]
MLEKSSESDLSATAAASQPPLDVQAAIAEVRAFIDPLLEEAVDRLAGAPERLRESIRYALLAPGKRLRPALAIWAAEACGGSRQQAAAGAMAVEMIHAYSLVHDDLPAMDDDDLRRGRPTCHRAFDEATAILCGDALQPLAFETLVRLLPADQAGHACGILAAAAGAEALVGGQAEDLAAEQAAQDRSTEADSATAHLARLEGIHRCKTGALFLACLRLGGLTAGASPEQTRALQRYGEAFGLAFQIADDLLDAEGTEEAVGKRVGKDADRGKLTFPSLVGLEASRARGHALAAEAAAACEVFGSRGAPLAALAHWIIHRNH